MSIREAEEKRSGLGEGMDFISEQSSGFVGEAGYSGSGESSDQVDGREGWLPGMGGLLS